MTNGFGGNQARIHFPVRLKSALRAAGWSQQDLVRKTGISPTAISNYLRGKSLPAADQFARIARELNHVASLTWLGCETDLNSIETTSSIHPDLPLKNLNEVSNKPYKSLLVPGVGRVEVSEDALNRHILFDGFRGAQKTLANDPLYQKIVSTYKPNRFPSLADKRALGSRVEERCIYLVNKHQLDVKPLEALCFHTRLSKVGVTNIIKGLVYPRDHTLFSLSAALGVSPYWLEYGNTVIPAESGDKLVKVDNITPIQRAIEHLVDTDNLPDVNLPDEYHMWVDETGEFNLDLSPNTEVRRFSDIFNPARKT
jgi:transcriptional regulator with XRE-family HTH domain